MHYTLRNELYSYPYSANRKKKLLQLSILYFGGISAMFLHHRGFEMPVVFGSFAIMLRHAIGVVEVQDYFA